jgi:dTDP-4-amino-4,6-dideoxygalactose transaminase
VRIPFVDLRPRLRETERELKCRFTALLERAQFILGEEVASFEEEFAREMGARHAVAVGNGTDAIALSLRAQDIRNGKNEVLTTALTASFTGLAILAAGCKPRFADIDPETLLLDPADTANRLTKRTAAVVPVHLYGQPCDLSSFVSLARSANTVIVQDACQAHGARLAGKPLAAFSPCVAYSFYPTKNLGCLGDGGAVLTNSRSVAGRLRLLRDGGRRANHVSHVAGMNSRLDEMQAAFLRAFLPRLPRWTEQRRRLARLYEEQLADCPGIQIVRQRPGSVYHLFVIRARNRERLRSYLEQHGIGTAVHYPVPLHQHPAFRDCGIKRGDLPHAERACREILSLPLWSGVAENVVPEIVGRIRAFYSKKA